MNLEAKVVSFVLRMTKLEYRLGMGVAPAGIGIHLRTRMHSTLCSLFIEGNIILPSSPCVLLALLFEFPSVPCDLLNC